MMRPRRGNGEDGQYQPELLGELARFRYEIRKFLRFSERAAREAGFTPQQHQLLLGVAGFTGRGWATISELAEFLQEHHNTVVELIKRARRNGFVSKHSAAGDRRVVRVELTRRGRRILQALSALHRRELEDLVTRGGLRFGGKRRPAGRSR